MNIKDNKNSPMEIVPLAEKVSDFYSHTTWLRVLVAAIPTVGGSADILISAKPQNIFQRRCTDLLNNFSDQVKNLTEDKIDKSFLDSEEWFDLVLQAVDFSVKTRHKDKIFAYAKILSAALPVQDRKKHSPEDYLIILSEMSLTDFNFANTIYEQQNIRPLANEDTFTWLHRINVCEQVEIEKAGKKTSTQNGIALLANGHQKITNF